MMNRRSTVRYHPRPKAVGCRSKLDRQSDSAQLFQEDRQVAWVEADRREPEKRRSGDIGSTQLYAAALWHRGVACINPEPELVCLSSPARAA
jgi:hypothetical protein